MRFEKSVTNVGQPFTRWKLNIWKGWKISVHRIDMKPSDGVWHSHGWDSLSLCFWGWMLERTEAGDMLVFPGRIRFRPRGFKHKVLGNQIWTLIVTSPRKVNACLYPDGPEGRPVHYQAPDQTGDEAASETAYSGDPSI